jgi:hypothetical protein
VAQLANHNPLDFEAQITKPQLPILKLKLKNLSLPVLRSNREKSSPLVLSGENHPSGFEAKPLTNRRPWF